MTNVDKKIVSTCDCPNSKGGKDVIVITIETCCKRTCEHRGVKSGGRELQQSEDETTTEVLESGESSHALDKKMSSSRALDKTTSSSHTLDKKMSSSRGLDKKMSSSPVVNSQSEPSSSDLDKRTSSSPAVNKSEPKLKIVPDTTGKMYKLPLLIERFHGRGCAMEINVLEKHEGTCMYKKEEGEGRSIEDRVGSYECIGRMVFRTCNPSELESDSSGVAGGIRSSVEDKPARPPIPVAHSTPETSPHSTPQPSTTKQPSIVSSPSAYGSVKSHHSDSSDQKTAVNEETIKEEKQEELQSARKGRHSRKERVLMATTHILPDPSVFHNSSPLGPRRHFPGDDCKLHIPRSPLMIPGGQFDKIYSSKKTFPVYTDGSNQTDSGSDLSRKSKVSSETITSLTDLSKTAEKRKSSFFGSLFRKNSFKSAGHTYPKRFKR